MAEPRFFRLTDFSGGLNKDQHEILLKDNEATSILNFRLDKIGSLIARNGTSEIEGFAPPNQRTIGQIGVWTNPANPTLSRVMVKLLRTAGGAADSPFREYDPNLPGLVHRGDLQAIANTARGRFANAEDLLLYADGVMDPCAFNPSFQPGGSGDGNFLPLGLAAPLVPTQSGTPSGTVPNHSWSFVTTFVNTSTSPQLETVPSPILTVATVASGGVTISRSSASDFATHWNLYARDDTDPNGIFYLVNSAPIPYATTSYSWTDPNILLPIEPPYSNLPAPKLETIAYFNGTYFGAIGNKLYWSSPLTPFAWPWENQTTLPFEGNDRVMGLASLQDSLIIFGRKNILVVSGYNPVFTITRLDAAIGLVGMDAFEEIAGQVVFYSDEGLRVYPGLQVIAPTIARTLNAEGLANKEAAILRHSPRENALWLVVGGRTYVVFLATQAVSVYNFDPKAVLSGGVTSTGWNLLVTSDGLRGLIHEGDTDEGTNIPVTWTSKVFQMDNPETTKFVRRIGMFASRGSAALATISLKDNAGSLATVPLVAQGVDSAFWDEFNWDEANWSTDGIVYFIGALPAQVLIGMTLQVSLDGSVEAGTEFIPPITLLYRESLRFLGR